MKKIYPLCRHDVTKKVQSPPNDDNNDQSNNNNNYNQLASNENSVNHGNNDSNV